MDHNIQFTTARLPKVLGALSHSNQFLKLFSVATLVLSLLSITLVYVTGMRPPLILTFNTQGQSVNVAELPRPEDLIRAAIQQYIAYRYKWNPADVKQNLKTAEVFVHPSALSAYQAAVGNITKFSIEKAVSQRIYSEKIEVSLERKVVVVTGDRITAIQGIKAAGPLRLELAFENGPRTRENPWGLYITKEREE